jgi:hypothetical protein
MAITRQRIDAQGRPIGVAEVVGSSTVTQPVGRGYFVEVNGVSVYKPPSSTVSFSPRSSSKSYTTTRTVALPEKEYAKYEGPEEETARISLKGVFGSTPKQRQTYVREVEDFNRQVKQEKQKVADYNKEVEAWNKSGRFTTVTETRVVQEKGYDIDIKKTEIQKSQEKVSETKSFLQTPMAKPSTLQLLTAPQFSKKKEEEKPTLFSELKSQASQRYLTIPRYIGKGFQTIGESIKTKDITKVSEPLKTSVGDLKTGVSMVPGTLYGGGKAFVSTAVRTQPFRKDYISGLYSETKAFREELKTPQRQAELILITGETALAYGVYTATTPKIVQKPTLRASTRIVDTPSKLKPLTTDATVAITKYKTVSPEIRSTFFGLKKTPVYYEGKLVSYTPLVKDAKVAGNIFSKKPTSPQQLTSSLKLLEAPTKSGLPAVIAKPPKINILKQTTFKGTETVSGVPKIAQDITPVFQATKGEIKYKIGSKIVTEKVDDLGLLITKQKATVSGQPLPVGAERFQTIDIFKNQKSDLIQIDPTLIKQTLSKTDTGFIFSKTKPPKTIDLQKFYLAKTDTANIYGFTYLKKDLALRGTKASTRFTPLPESRAILSQTAESFRLYPPALPSPSPQVATGLSASSVFTLKSTGKLDRILAYKKFMDKSKPLTVLTPEKLDVREYFGTLDSGLTQKQLLKIKYKLDKSEPTATLKIGESTTTQKSGGLIQELKFETSTKSKTKTAPKLEFEKTRTTVTEPRLATSNLNFRILKPKLKSQIVTAMGSARFSGQSQATREQQRNILQLSPVTITTPKQKRGQFLGLRTGLISVQSQAQLQAQATTTTQVQDAVNKYEQMTPKIPRFYFKSLPTVRLFKLPGIEERESTKTQGEPAYNVYIKVGSNWVNKTQGQRNLYSAIHHGSDIVDNTVAKSFKIKKGTGTANIFKYNLPYNINKFYTPSKTRSAKLTGAYIEKNQYAIDTVGERRGLSVAKYLRGKRL